MMAFGQHLGAKQNQRLAGLNAVINFLPAANAAGGIAVHPHHLIVREQLLQVFFNLGRTHAQGFQFTMLALRTLLRLAVNGTTMMAMQMGIWTMMQGKVGITMRALCLPATAVTDQHWRITAAV